MSALPTLRSVAERTGLSTASVSLALRDSKEVSAATRKRVKQVARELGYRSDPMLAALASHRWKRRPNRVGATLAVLVDAASGGEAGMAERALVYGYKVEVFRIRDYPDGRRLSDVLYNRGILGVIIRDLYSGSFFESFDWSRFVTVASGRGDYRPPVHVVVPNYFRAVQDAWDKAWERGYRRIGLALFDAPMLFDYQDRNAAFLDRQQRVPASGRIPVFALKPGLKVDSPAVKKGINEWMLRYKPDVILSFNSAFYWLLRAAGWRIPEQVGFIDLLILSNLPRPAWPGLVASADECGRHTIDWLNSLLQAGERGLPAHPATMSIDMRWYDGKPARRKT